MEDIDRLSHDFPDLIRGNQYPIEVDFVDENELPMSVDGRVLYVTFKHSTDFPDTEALLQIGFTLTGTDAIAGTARKSITPRQTLTLPAVRLYMDYKLVDGEGSAITIAGGRVAVRNSATWTVGPDETPPMIYAPVSASLEFPRFAAGLAKDDPGLVAVLDGLVAVDQFDGQLPVVADLSLLADPIPAGTYSVPLSAMDVAGNVATDLLSLIVAESATTTAIEILQTWSTTSFTVESA